MAKRTAELRSLAARVTVLLPLVATRRLDCKRRHFIVSVLATLFASRCGFAVAPTAAGLVLVAAYPIWSWRRLEATVHYLDQEYQLLGNQPHLLPEAPHIPTLLAAARR